MSLLLPLHLCSISAIMGTAAVFSNNRMLKEFSYGVGLPGGMAAMANPNLGPYPLFSFFFAEYTLTHILLILLPLLYVFGDGFRPDVRSLSQSHLLGNAFHRDGILGQPNDRQQLYVPQPCRRRDGACAFRQVAGNAGYLIAVLLSIFISWAILYAPWEIPRRRNFSG